jgi:predicted ATPase/Tfp pilus assembly protein PilF/DNA-binding XRE family transcriptional regulator
MVIERHESFADLLRRFRRAAGLTQQALADESQVSRRTIADLERGINRPHKTTLELLAAALQLNAQDRFLFESAAHRSPLKTTPLATTLATSALPYPLTRLIGREQDERAILHLILHVHYRLVTLIGMAGIGKTRLAISMANKLLPHFPDGVYFVPLAHVQDWKLIPAMIAQALHLQEDKTQSLWDLITAACVDKTAVLVLDNLEHLLEGAAFVADLLAACPSLVILVTSRAALRVRGEQRFPVPPLSFAGDAEERGAAEELFIERAREVEPLLPLTSDNAASIAEICRRLEGIPLAIELAAMRAATFPPAALLRHLERRLPVLVVGARDLPQRQRTMRDAIAWSYDLLSPQEQAVFRRLAIFAGGWTLLAARAVCDFDADPSEMTSLLSSLVETNLVQRWPEDDSEESRFNMLEILREYGLEQLVSHGELESAQRRHAEWMLTLAQAAAPALRGSEQGRWLRLLDQELGNLRLALQWAREHDANFGLCLITAAHRFWYMSRNLSEGLFWLETFLGMTQDHKSSPLIRAKATFGASVIAVESGKYEQAAHFAEESFQLFQDAGDLAGMCSVLDVQGRLAHVKDHFDQAEEYYRQALSLSRSMSDKGYMAMVLNNLGMMLTEQGRYHEARMLLEESLSHIRALGHHQGIASSLVNLSCLYCKQEEYEQAAAFAEESLIYAKQSGDRQAIAIAFNYMGEAAAGKGDYQQAIVALEQSRQLFEELHDVSWLADVLKHLGDVALKQHQWQQTET